jgi:lipopolysaccharide export system permease protein
MFFTQIDRLLLIGYFKAFIICLVSLLSLYIVVDLFTNLDEFTHHNGGLLPVLKHIGTYYGYRSTQIYDRLSEAIVLLAGVFTVAWMQRSNELIPLLAAGVPTRRVILPILIGACVMVGVTIANQELVIPRIGNELQADRDDPQGDKDIHVEGGFEPNGVHVEGHTGWRKELLVKPFFCTIPEGVARNMVHLSAEEAHYIPPGEGPRSGGWLLTGTQPAQLENWERPDVIEMIDPGKYFLPVREMDFDAITRTSKWYNFASTWRLYRELQNPDSARLASMAVMFHTRLTRPILGMLLVVMGLSVILRDHNRNVFLSAGMCVVLCGVFFAAFFTCKSLGENNILSPALAAWMPVLFFGPLAFVMFDAVHT